MFVKFANSEQFKYAKHLKINFFLKLDLKSFFFVFNKQNNEVLKTVNNSRICIFQLERTIIIKKPLKAGQNK